MARCFICRGIRNECELMSQKLPNSLRCGEFSRVEFGLYAQHLDSLPSVWRARAAFPAQHPELGFGSDALLINVRAGEIANGIHPDYVLIPPSFYEHLLEFTGLRPVFMGQIDQSAYVTVLRDRFPSAEFVQSRGAVADFETIRHSKNIVPSVSSFSWLAAWLSDATNIFLPVNGLLNPFQATTIDLLPLTDPRYSFYLFPANYGFPFSESPNRLSNLDGLWRKMARATLDAMKRDAPRIPADREMLAELFDEQLYLRLYPDVAEAVRTGRFRSALSHFWFAGEREGRVPFLMDVSWYCATYVPAAIEIGQGDYRNPFYHYAQIGRSRGYRPNPESNPSIIFR